jgi:NAD(P)-dependent dehydrogenase (short-subunit alcohol dehydrogenase family)
VTEDVRTTLITGAADGIGWAMARRFAAGGDRVVVADLRQDAAEVRAAELGEGHYAVRVDVAAEFEVQQMVAATLARFGRLDVLINNAGIGDTQLPTIEQTVEAFDRLIGIHLRGTFLASREAARVMLERGQGAIVNVSSIAGLLGLPRRNAYGAAKAGIAAMTRAMACEWAGQGIRVNAIAPGYVQTELVAELAGAGRLNVAAIKRRTPMGRLAHPEEIAEAAWFLASPQASFITGTVLSVDGGWAAFGEAMESG